MASSVASTSTLPAFDSAQLDAANALLAESSPQEILRWAVANLPGLYQTTAFGLTGLASLDMLSKISKKAAADKSNVEHLVPVIFIDTMYHFKETLALRERLERKYKIQCKVYTPPGVSTPEQFEERYGEELWKTDEDTYDYLVKVSTPSSYPISRMDPRAANAEAEAKAVDPLPRITPSAFATRPAQARPQVRF